MILKKMQSRKMYTVGARQYVPDVQDVLGCVKASRNTAALSIAISTMLITKNQPRVLCSVVLPSKVVFGMENW